MESQERAFHPNQRVYRRKRRYQGATWTPPSMSADTPDGLWCRACKQRHGYMSLGLSYEKDRHDQWVMIWSCSRTGNVVGTTTLGGSTGGPSECA